MRNRPRGFTLVELLVVIAIIGVLVGLLLPAVQSAREAARRSQCTNNLKQLSLSFLNYEDTRKSFPVYQKHVSGWNSWQGHGVWTQILPFIEEQGLYDQYDFTNRFDHGNNNGANRPGRAKIGVFNCPTDRPFPDRNWGGINYAVNGGATVDLYGAGTATDAHGAMMRRQETTLAELSDGTSKTLLVSEFLKGDNSNGMRSPTRDFTNGLSIPTVHYPTPAEVETAGIACDGNGYQQSNAGKHWNGGFPGACVFNTVAPPNWKHVNCATGGGFGYAADRNGIVPARSMHPSVVVAAAADGSVHVISETVDPITWQRLGARGDAQPVSWE